MPCIDSGFFSQTRLADPRLANEHHQRRLPVDGGVDCGPHRGHLLGTANEPSPGQASRGGRQPEVFGLTCCGRRAEFFCRPGFFAVRRPVGKLPVRSDG
jgi:hypothetical protein